MPYRVNIHTKNGLWIDVTEYQEQKRSGNSGLKYHIAKLIEVADKYAAVTEEEIADLVNREEKRIFKMLTAGEDGRARKTLEDMFDQLRTYLTKRARSGVETTIDDVAKIILDDLPDKYLQKSLNLFQDIPPEDLRKAYVSVQYRPPSESQVDEILSRQWPPQGSVDERGRAIQPKTYEQRITKITDEMSLAKSQSIIAQGIADGMGPIDIADLLAGSIRQPLSYLKTLARTETLRYHNTAKDLIFEAYSDFIGGVRYTATLDDRTEDSHADQDGDKYYYNPEPGQRNAANKPPLPSRPNCRCTYVPFLKPEDDLFAGLPEIRATEDGYGSGTFGEWFNQRSESDKQRLLQSDTRYELLKKLHGSVEWKHAINPQTRKFYSIGDLTSMTQGLPF